MIIIFLTCMMVKTGIGRPGSKRTYIGRVLSFSWVTMFSHQVGGSTVPHPCQQLEQAGLLGGESRGGGRGSKIQRLQSQLAPLNQMVGMVMVSDGEMVIVRWWWWVMVMVTWWWLWWNEMVRWNKIVDSRLWFWIQTWDCLGSTMLPDFSLIAR